jgi:hypothetical protein
LGFVDFVRGIEGKEIISAKVSDIEAGMALARDNRTRDRAAALGNSPLAFLTISEK